METLTLISELNWAISQTELICFRWNGGTYKSDFQYWKHRFQNVNWLVRPDRPKSCEILQLKEIYNLFSIKNCKDLAGIHFTTKEEKLQEGAVDQNTWRTTLESPAQRLFGKEERANQQRKFHFGGQEAQGWSKHCQKSNPVRSLQRKLNSNNKRK